MLEVFYQTVGIASENTYVVVNEKKEALIIDPGAGAPMLIHWIKSHHWQPQAILLTHCHFDHIESVDELRDAFGRSEEHTSELQSRFDLVCRLLLEKKRH